MNVEPSVWVPITSAAALIVWALVVAMERDHVRHTERLPGPVREASLVAVMAASAGGMLTALGWVDLISNTDTAFLAIAWRAAVLACGIYAVIGSAMDGRAS